LKKVIFRIPYQPEFQFDGEHKFAKRKTQSVCATAEIKKEGVPVWNEFSAVFKEISGVSPDKAVEFSIDIIPGIVPISKSPYRMFRDSKETAVRIF